MIDTTVIVLAILGLIGIGGMIWCTWASYCNNRTYNQRLEIIDLIAEKGNFRMWSEFDRVDYADHARALERFKDPYKLYPQTIQDLIKQ